MRQSTSSAVDSSAATGRYGPDGRDRRKRKRVKLAMPVRISGGVGSTDAFEDMAKTIDASRDGLLVSTGRGNYRPGQIVEVRLGNAAAPAAHGPTQRARVIRNVLVPEWLSYAVALEYQTGDGQKPNTSLSSFETPRQRVLFVEPDERIATLMTGLLGDEGYEVTHATSGEEALEFLLDKTPDVLLAGIEVGEIDGRELCSLIKDSDRLRHIPVVLLTRSGLPSDYSACHRAGAVLCMAMPCSPNKLQNAIRLVAPPRFAGGPSDRMRNVPRYAVAASTEITDGHSVRIPARVSEISRKGCYVDVLNTLPVGTLRRLKITRTAGTFTTIGRVIYVHERIGMGMVFVDTPRDQAKILDSWLCEFAGGTCIQS